jgi:hypothetical protein
MQLFSFYGLKDVFVCYFCSCCEIQISWPLSYGWNHTTGGGGGQKCCHIILFSRGVHVWTSIMVILEHIFSIFLHSMVDYNTKNSITKKIFQLIMCNSKIIFVTKKCTLIRTKKCKYIQKMIEMIFNLYEICSIYLKLWFLMTGISLWTMWRIW